MDVQVQHHKRWEQAVKFFGSPQKAELWFHTRLSELEDRTPEDVLEQDPQNNEVEAILGRIECGVFK